LLVKNKVLLENHYEVEVSRLKGKNQVENTRHNLERLLRKKVDALCVHVTANMTSHTLRIFLRQRFGIDVLTFEQHSLA
jgi:hypothetical protein